MNPKPINRPVKEVYRCIIRDEWFRRFTIWERLRIICGFNLLVYIRIPTRHNAGHHQPIIGARTTKHMTPDTHLIELLEQACRDAGADEISPPPLNPISSSRAFQKSD